MITPETAAYIIVCLCTTLFLVLAGSFLYDHTFRLLWLTEIDNSLWELEKRLNTLSDVPQTEIDAERSLIIFSILCAQSLNINLAMVHVLLGVMDNKGGIFAAPQCEKLRQIDDERVLLLVRAVRVNSPIAWGLYGLLFVKPVSYVQRFAYLNPPSDLLKSCVQNSLQPFYRKLAKNLA